MNNITAIIRPLVTLLLILVVCVIFFYGKPFLIPLFYGILFAFLVNPIHSILTTKGMNKYISALLAVSVILTAVLILISVFGWQVQQLIDQSDEIKDQLIQTQQSVYHFIKEKFDIAIVRQEKYAEQTADKLLTTLKSSVGDVLSVITSFFIALIYAILFLGEKKRIKNFFFQLMHSDQKARDASDETAEVTQQYLIGKIIIICILAVMYAVGFLLLGIQYAVLIGVIASILTFIPYLGNLLGGLLAVLIALATGGTLTDVMIIIAIISSAQVVESYILTPWIIGDHVNINPLFSILSVIAFGSLWGAAGAIIALPLTGSLKVLFSHLESYQPLSYLLGNQSVTDN